MFGHSRVGGTGTGQRRTGHRPFAHLACVPGREARGSRGPSRGAARHRPSPQTLPLVSRFPEVARQAVNVPDTGLTALDRISPGGTARAQLSLPHRPRPGSPMALGSLARSDVDTSPTAAWPPVTVFVRTQGGVALGVAKLLAASSALIDVHRADASWRPSQTSSRRPASRGAAPGRGMKRPMLRELNGVARPERGRSGADAADRVDAISAVPRAVGSLSVEEKPPAAAPP